METATVSRRSLDEVVGRLGQVEEELAAARAALAEKQAALLIALALLQESSELIGRYNAALEARAAA